MDPVFRALADPTRRALLDRLEERNGQTLAELCDGLAMARQSVSKHLRLLEDAGLVTTHWRGREKLHFLDAAPINAIADRWLSRYDRRRAQALADLETALEAAPMNEFVYTTYIRTTPETLWEALTDPAFTSRYWGVELTSDWQVGSVVSWRFSGVTMADERGVVVESDPPRRLAYHWHPITPEFGKAIDLSDDDVTRLAAEPRSLVTFDLEQQGELVRLRVTHGGFAEGSELLPGISEGWPAILASLKTLLETGKPLPA
ncbi:metalloregulator ArsR/SmtB family transcription factor [Nocardioides sp. YIM 152315]|uniref:ArsR/SmtB family transcription factor n=1 Tax=Nocardioides sp. YIM 152315 TaxID=3031760 RepID=UPI0023D9B649|nr:metalloregulator ArsR/SmtB family transcription factor [Nocardioides sp. YIM 152315]MDF1603817.1 metalloregulator ArsR/SmtB family transcription factor [Nocardioides sp. YIM 152315]